MRGDRVRCATGGHDPDRASPLLVFLHGAGMDGTVWSLVTRAFAHHGWAVLAPDLPGHGGSEGAAPSSIEAYADWLEALLDTAGWRDPTLVGHSMGSLIAVELAGTRPDRVGAVALLGITDPMVVNPDLMRAADDHDPVAIDLIMGWSLSPHGKLGSHPTPGLRTIDAAKRMMRRNDPAVLASDLHACARYTATRGRGAAMTCPTLVLLAGNDRMTTGGLAVAEAVPGASVTRLPATGHLMMMERPHDVISALAAFLPTPTPA